MTKLKIDLYLSGLRRTAAFLTVFALMLSCFTGCQRLVSNTDKDDIDSPNTREVEFKPMENPDISDNEPIVADMNGLGLKLLQLINKDKADKNLIISPLSLCTVLSILSSGAKNDTQAQIGSLINSQSLSADELTQKYYALISLFYGRDQVNMELANSLWLQKGLKFQESFSALMNKYYDSDIFNIDFSAANAAGDMNGWIKDKTHGLITDPIKEVDASAITYIINSLYFKGTWKDKFNANITSKDDFTLSSGEVVQVDMMYGENPYDYYEGEELQALRMPYEGGVSMLFILPKGDIFDLLGNMNEGTLEEITNGLSSYLTTVKIPKLDFSCDSPMGDYLYSLGMKDAFSMDSADFSGIIEKTEAPFCVGGILHDCVIKLDEDGTEAAAVTIVEGEGAMQPPDEIREFFLDRPFLFAIMDDATQTMLFLGKVENPSLK